MTRAIAAANEAHEAVMNAFTRHDTERLAERDAEIERLSKENALLIASTAAIKLAATELNCKFAELEAHVQESAILVARLNGKLGALVAKEAPPFEDVEALRRIGVRLGEKYPEDAAVCARLHAWFTLFDAADLANKAVEQKLAPKLSATSAAAATAD
jgi:hypothetical protein